MRVRADDDYVATFRAVVTGISIMQLFFGNVAQQRAENDRRTVLLKIVEFEQRLST